MPEGCGGDRASQEGRSSGGEAGHRAALLGSCCLADWLLLWGKLQGKPASGVLTSKGSGDSQPQFRPVEMSGWAAGSLSLPGASSSSWALFGSFHLAGMFKPNSLRGFMKPVQGFPFALPRECLPVTISDPDFQARAGLGGSERGDPVPRMDGPIVLTQGEGPHCSPWPASHFPFA